MPRLNSKSSNLSDRCFQCIPPNLPDLKNLQSLPEDWFEKLSGLCNVKVDAFNKHLKNADLNKYPLLFRNSTISLKEALQFIYLTLSHLNCKSSYYSAIVLKLTEDIEFCTPGFINRVADIVTSLQEPQNLDELLYQSRLDLVNTVAAKLATTQTQQIHAWNQVLQIAANNNLGVKGNFKDPFSSNLTYSEIKKYLEKEFSEKFTPFYLPFLLEKQLRGLASLSDYQGAQATGYTVGIAENITEKIKTYLHAETFKNLTCQDFFEIVYSDDDEDCYLPILKDIKWNVVRNCFFNTLLKEGYFVKAISENDIHSLVDCASFSSLLRNNQLLGSENKYIMDSLFNNNDVYSQLKKIETEFAAYWENLRDCPALIDKTISWLIKTIEKNHLIVTRLNFLNY
ncbi:uncharacterized protein RVIR1_14290 [Candidatus Rickettsiella viridis]|uniref:Uncharacterized protein n=1 Tax=Candidatus Rickettsiella viridis TaxID=676208 RepID=A0A2Z5UXM3_9COXI|nr:hypothetical protein [Candidatus Rickettsiella viridis]BBB15873.1 uncharacterized protein RVIR1_14290 [Candidatus Rickettsiella viridis]